MLKIQFDRRADRPDAAGRCPIHLRAYFDGQRLRVATREKCLITEWNADKGRFRAVSCSVYRFSPIFRYESLFD